MRSFVLFALALVAGCASTNPGTPDYLEDVPLPRGYTRAGDDTETKSYFEEHDKWRNARLTWKGQGTVQDAADFVRRNMKERGWVEENSTEGAERDVMLSYTKELERAKIWIKPHKTETEVSVITLEIALK